jgi:Ca2+-binding RTX toxin-like protein
LFLVGTSFNDTIDGGAGDDTLSLAGRNIADATLDTTAGVTTISFTDGSSVQTQHVETVIFDDDVLKL